VLPALETEYLRYHMTRRYLEESDVDPFQGLSYYFQEEFRKEKKIHIRIAVMRSGFERGAFRI
jgi:hypothetical protein